MTDTTPAVLDTAECLRRIAEGDDFGPLDAEDILLAEIPNARRRFRAIDKSLRRLLAEVREAFPDATYYTGGGSFNLMIGHSHSERGGRGQSELIALSGQAQISDGDF